MFKEIQVCLENKHCLMDRFEQTVVNFLSLAGLARWKYNINSFL